MAQLVCPRCPGATWVMRQSIENQQLLDSPEPVYEMECIVCRYSLLIRVAHLQSTR